MRLSDHQADCWILLSMMIFTFCFTNASFFWGNLNIQLWSRSELLNQSWKLSLLPGVYVAVNIHINKWGNYVHVWKHLLSGNLLRKSITVGKRERWESKILAQMSYFSYSIFFSIWSFCLSSSQEMNHLVYSPMYPII